MGTAKVPNEHTVILEDGGHAVRCRTIKRRPKDARWDGKTISGIVATPREPNPSEPDKKEMGTGVTMKFEKPEPLTKPEALAEEEVVRRNSRITNNRILENMVTRQDALVARRRSPAERGRIEHTDACRNRIENKMLEDPDEKGWIDKRDKRRPTGKETSSTSAAPEIPHTKEEETHEYELMNEDGGPADAGDGVPELSPEDVAVGVEADEEHDVLYGPETGESETTRLKSSVPEGNLEHEPEAKRRKLANVHRSQPRFTQVLRLQKYDGSLQKVTKMLLDLEFGKTKDHHENVTSIVEKLADRKDMCTPHDDDE